VRVDDVVESEPLSAAAAASCRVGPEAGDAELVTLGGASGAAGVREEARWLRHVRSHLRHLFPHEPNQPGGNKAVTCLRLCNAALTQTSRGAPHDQDRLVRSDNAWAAEFPAHDARAVCGPS
jgi:hypothetical protein